MMRIHPSVTEAVILDAVERQNQGLDDPGFCTACGREAEGCEPDMRNARCEFCGSPNTVFGAEELLMMLFV